MKTLGCIAFGFIVLTGLTFAGWGLRALMLPGRAIDRGLTTAEGIIDKTLTAENAIYNYEWFKQQIEDIKAVEAKIQIANDAASDLELSAGPRKDWTFEDKNEVARLWAVYNGLRSQREEMIANYNARAKMANRNIFQDGKIPGFIEVGSSFLR